MKWTKVVDRLPPFGHGKVMVFTEGFNFNGEQFFTVEAEDLYHGSEESGVEVIDSVSHWAEMPYPAKSEKTDFLCQALNEGNGTYKP